MKKTKNIIRIVKFIGGLTALITFFPIFHLASIDEAMAYNQYPYEHWDVFPYLVKWMIPFLIGISMALIDNVMELAKDVFIQIKDYFAFQK